MENYHKLKFKYDIEKKESAQVKLKLEKEIKNLKANIDEIKKQNMSLNNELKILKYEKKLDSKGYNDNDQDSPKKLDIKKKVPLLNLGKKWILKFI